MRIYLTGASSTGKSTLARKLAARLDIPLVSDIARETGREMGLGPREINDHDTLLDYQERIMARMERRFHVHDSLVSDRCPSDVAAYAALGIARIKRDHGGTPGPSHRRRLRALRDRARTLLLKHPPDVVVVAGPDVPFHDDGFRLRMGPEARRAEHTRLIREAWRLSATVPLLPVWGSVERRLQRVLDLLSGAGETRAA